MSASPSRLCQIAAAMLLMLTAAGCRRTPFPSYPDNYREYAYVSNGSEGTVTVLDLIYLRRERVLQVGREPTGLAVNPRRNEVYVVNAGSDSVTVIDAAENAVKATIGVQRAPYFIEVAPDGKRAYVPNSRSNTVSVLDLETRREVAAATTGQGPGVARVSPDNRTLVVSNRVAGSLSVYSIEAEEKKPLQLRETFSGCPGATDVVIAPNSMEDPASGAKAFVACSGGHQLMEVWLAAEATSWRGRQDASLQHDQMLAMLDVGKTPTHLALKADGGEVMVTNFDSDSVSEVSTWTNEVSGTYIIGAKPSRAVFSRDNSSLWVTNFGADSASMYSVDDGRVGASVRTGSRPDALVFSTDEHLLLVVDTGSADVAVIRTQKNSAPTLFTLLPGGAHPNDVVVKAFKTR